MKEIYDYCCYHLGECIPLTEEQYQSKKSSYSVCNDKNYEISCSDISPEKASDCVKSSKDEGKYCCYEYENLFGDPTKSCDLYESDTQVKTLKDMGMFDELVCPGYDNNLIFINIKYISILLSLMFLF